MPATANEARAYLLSNPGVSLREAARVLGLSHQRLAVLRQEVLGPRPTPEPTSKVTVAVPAAEVERAKARGETIGDRIRAALSAQTARESQG